MSDQHEVHLASDPASFMSLAMHTWGQQAVFFTPAPAAADWTLDEWDGMPALSWTATDTFGNTFTRYVVLTCMQTTQTVPARIFLTYTGMSTAILLSQTIGDSSWISPYEDSWEIWLDALLNFVIACTDVSTATVIDTTGSVDIDLHQIILTAVLKFTLTDASVIYIVLGANSQQQKSESGPPLVVVDGYSINRVQSDRTEGLFVSADLSRLVDAVEAISDQDIETSINQNSSVYSIKSKVLVGP